MRILVLELPGATPELLLGDDRLATLRRLMEAGLYGRLDGEGPVSGGGDAAATLRDGFARAGRRAAIATRHGTGTGLDDLVRRDDWDLLLAVADETEDYRAFDDRLASLLEHLDDRAAVLIASGPGAFVLAGAGVPALGEVAGARAIDLAATLLALAGLDAPGSMPGRPLVAPSAGTPPPPGGGALDEDPDLLARLRGLGYL